MLWCGSRFLVLARARHGAHDNARAMLHVVHRGRHAARRAGRVLVELLWCARLGGRYVILERDRAADTTDFSDEIS
eukprot:scaffold279331_cov22-Tisochrysis_lutea.AAC.3